MSILQISSSFTSAKDNEAKLIALKQLVLETNDRQELQVSELDSLSEIINSALHSNSHLQAAALLLVQDYAKALCTKTASISNEALLRHLKQSLDSLVAGGGIFDRLGDSRLPVRESARVGLDELANTCLTLQPLSQNDGVSHIFDRALRDQGFGSKIGRCREQSILLLATIRSKHTSTPLRPYVPLLLNCLEDSDSAVREAAREGIVNIFHQPGISAAAKSDLKTQLSNRSSLKKAAADQIISQVFAGPAEASNSPSRQSVSRTDSVASTAASSSTALAASSSADNVAPVYVASSQDVESEFRKMIPAFEGKESEHNWQVREQNVHRIRGMLKGNVATQFQSDFINGIRTILEGLMKTLASLRTTLSVATCQMITETASTIHRAIDSLADPFLTNLLKSAASTKRILVQAVEAAITAIFENCSFSPKLLSHLAMAFADKNVSARQLAARQFAVAFGVHGSMPAVEQTGALQTFVDAISKGIVDPNLPVRETFRTLFWQFQAAWPQPAQKILDNLDNPTRSQVEKANPQASSSPKKPVAKPRPSLRDMIATKRSSTASLKTDASNDTDVPSLASKQTLLSQSVPGPSRHYSSSKVASRPSDVPATSRRASYMPRRPPSRLSQVSTSPPASLHLSPKNDKTPLPISRRPSQATTRHSRQDTKSTSVSVSSTSPEIPHQLVLDTASSGTQKNAAEDVVALDAMREQAKQAEQAAQRLLEVADEQHASTPTVSRTNGNYSTPKPRPNGMVSVDSMFADSPESKPAPSRFNMAESWWLQRGVPPAIVQPYDLDTEAGCAHFESALAALACRTLSQNGFHQFSRTSTEYSVTSATSDSMILWQTDSRFSRLFQTLKDWLGQDGTSKDLVDPALYLLKDLVVNQSYLISGHNTDLFALLLTLRKDKSARASAAISTILALVVESNEPLYALSSLRYSLTQFLAANKTDEPAVAHSFAMALKGFGMLFAELPAEILEDELPHCRLLLQKALDSKVPDTRHAAVRCLVAAHQVIQDERRLIDLVGNLTPSHEALLTYFIAKHNEQSRIS